MSTAPRTPSQPQFQFPQPIIPFVAEIQRLAALYAAATDPALKAAYKIVIVDRIAATQAAATAYGVSMADQLTSLTPA